MPLYRLLSLAYTTGCVVFIGLILLSSLSMLTACAPRSGLFAEGRAPSPAAPNVAVLQSDVLVIDGQAVHLADAVTPQPSPDAHCPAEALAARQVALRLKTLVTGVRTAAITPAGGKDSYNRPFAHVLLDGADPAHELVEDGLAVRPGGRAFNWCGPISAGFPRAEHIAVLSFSGT
ncbi:nuclease [Phenylobacterium sp.]|jgi:endonuclease YncB( thermonuclease family)|uniref:thermonuclease family protein n=1 Tax=Phenylobacterium sp. TaxID=1871053 RepID=UPI002F3EAE9E